MIADFYLEKKNIEESFEKERVLLQEEIKLNEVIKK